jgi:hypothetical protein
VLAIGAAGAALVLGAGYLVGGASGGDPEQQPADRTAESATRTLAGEDLGADVPSGWEDLDAAPEIDGLPILRSAAAAPPGGDGAIQLGVSDGGGTTLLPASFVSALGGPPEPDATVRLGDLEAYRYDALEPADGAAPVRLYVAPLRSGVATLACTGGLPSDQCDRVAASLRTDGASALPLGPRAEYGKPVGNALSRLADRRDAAQRRLTRASTRKGQAGAAADVAAAYAAAANALDEVRPGPLERDAHVRLVRGMRTARDAYDALGKAAKQGAAGKYAARRSRAARADGTARSRVRALADFGYRVG